MSEEDEKIATLMERSKHQDRRIENLEANQKWGVLVILGMVLKTLFDAMVAK